MWGWRSKPACWPNHWAVYDIIAAAMRDLKYMNQDDEATMRVKLTRGGNGGTPLGRMTLWGWPQNNWERGGEGGGRDLCQSPAKGGLRQPGLKALRKNTANTPIIAC